LSKRSTLRQTFAYQAENERNSRRVGCEKKRGRKQGGSGLMTVVDLLLGEVR